MKVSRMLGFIPSAGFGMSK